MFVVCCWLFVDPLFTQRSPAVVVVSTVSLVDPVTTSGGPTSYFQYVSFSCLAAATCLLFPLARRRRNVSQSRRKMRWRAACASLLVLPEAVWVGVGVGVCACVCVYVWVGVCVCVWCVGGRAGGRSAEVIKDSTVFSAPSHSRAPRAPTPPDRVSNWGPPPGPLPHPPTPPPGPLPHPPDSVDEADEKLRLDALFLEGELGPSGGRGEIGPIWVIQAVPPTTHTIVRVHHPPGPGAFAGATRGGNPSPRGGLVVVQWCLVAV